MRTLLGPTTLALAVPLALASAPTVADAEPSPAEDWGRVDVGTDQGLRGLDALDRNTAWVTGSDGGVWRTTDSGRTRRDVSPAEAEGLMLRDVEVVDQDRAPCWRSGPVRPHGSCALTTGEEPGSSRS